MATPIIAAVRQRHDLKESLFHTLIELAHTEPVRHVDVVVEQHRYLVERYVVRHADLDQRVAAADDILGRGSTA